MVVGEWRLPAAGQGRVCARTLGFLLDPGGGAVESYCGGGRRQSRATECHRGGSKSFSTVSSLRTSWGHRYSLIPSLDLRFQRFEVRHF